MKKLLAVLLSLCLVVGMLPMMAFADDVADTPQANFENTGVLNEGSQGDQRGKDDQIGGDQSGNSDPGEGDQGLGNDPAIEPYGEDLDTGKGYNADNIQSVDQLIAALNDNSVPEIHIGAAMDFTDDLEINRDVLIKGGPFNGPGKIIINADVKFVDVTVGTNVEVASGKTLTLSNEKATSTIDSSKISGEGTVLGTNGETIYSGEDTGDDNPGTNPGDDDEQEVPVEPVYYSVSFDVTPYWADVVVTDSTGNTVKPDRNGQYWLEAGKEYDYTVSAYGFISETGDIGLTNAIKVKLDQSDKVVVWPTSHGDVYFSYLSHGWVAVYTEPDSGYYLKDLTVYCVDHGAIDYGRWYDGVYYFRVKDGAKYIVDADFAALPDEHRVYVEPTVNGDLSVDEVWAEEGEWVYITVKPDAGYRLDELTVTRPSGNEVKVYHVRDNVFRFKMPGVRVTVDAEFVRSSLPFSDVSRGQWFYDYVAWAYNTGLMEGVSAGRFAPNSTTTRAMVVTIIYRLAGSPGVSGTSDFTDVPAGAWYSDAVTWAAKRGIVEGMTATTFDPNDAVTREELAAMLYRYAQHKGYDTSAAENTNILSYNDAGSISEYAFEALQWACGEGIINGTGGGSLEPGGSATRAQLAAMLYRFCAEYVY